MVLKLLERFKRGKIVATIPMERIVVPEQIKVPEYDSKHMEFIEKNYVYFSGEDSLELYWDTEKDKLIFRQEFGGHNELDDEDIKRVIDLCMRYLRRSNGADIL